MKTLINPNDKYKMNWVEGNTEWGTVVCPDGIVCKRQTIEKENTITERYTFTNTTKYDFFTSLTDISIYTPFNDDYKDSKTCITNRCNTHIWCGGDVSYVMALRMGGEAPHLGLVLTEGSLGGYSVARDLERLSNDRGDFLLHPSPIALIPNESFTIEWTLFWHDGKEDFYNKLKAHSLRYIGVNAQNYIVFEDENINISVKPVYEFNKKDVIIKHEDDNVDFDIKNGEIIINDNPKRLGEHEYTIQIGDTKTICIVLVLPKFMDLVKKRCNFIADKQQYQNPKSRLHGAYLIYDTEEKHTYYNPKNDYNGGRERIGMGILMTKYLQSQQDEYLQKSLELYLEYVRRELLDEETGEVFNDYMRDNSYHRLYNYPWMSVFFIELYRLYKSVDYLKIAYKVMCSYYKQGGEKFYALETPVFSMLTCLKNENLIDEYETLFKYFSLHSDYLIETGLNYPPHEVNYEQSIIAPATNILIQMYQITGDERYLAVAKEQMQALEQLNGLQPDYHMYEVAVRHWDGYWFGKNALFGDTYPHYWSSLTGNAYVDFGKITNDKAYAKKAEYSLRGTLSMFKPDGSASCAFVYPRAVNGKKGYYYDAYANDQDWAMYFMLRYKMNQER